MKNKISEVLGFITSGNLLHGLRSAKDLYSSFPDNLNIVKLLVYAYIQVGNLIKLLNFWISTLLIICLPKILIILIIWAMPIFKMKIMKNP